MGFPRHADWQARLTLFLRGVSRTPLAYGQHDCALFAAGAVQAMTGRDLAQQWRGRYRTLRGGLRVLRSAGFRDHVDLARTLLAAIPVAQAMPGDLAVLSDGDGFSLGVVQGGSVYVLSPAGYLGVVPLTDAVEVLRV